MKQTAAHFEQENKRAVSIADREADIYDLFLLADRLLTNFLVRASQNRKINILPSKHYKGPKEGNLNLDIYAIHIFEEKPPKGCEGLEWMLLSNIPVLTFQEAVEKMEWYCLRWKIEVYFKVIKSGFNVEDCRLERADRLIRYLAVVSIVAWRVYWLTLVSKAAPTTSALLFLNDFDWKILFAKFKPTRRHPYLAWLEEISRLYQWASACYVSISNCHHSYMAPAFTMTGLSPARRRNPSLGTPLFKM